MALTSSINDAVFSQSNLIESSGQITGSVIPVAVRTSGNGKKPFKVVGASLHLGGKNSAVSAAIGVENSTSSFFSVPQGVPIETGIKSLSYTFVDSPETFDINVYANGITLVGSNNFNGLNVETSSQTITNRTLVGRYEYIHVPASPNQPIISQITESSIRVSFSEPSDLGGGTLSGYQLQVATSSNFAFGLRVYNLSSIATYQDITSLTPGTTYYARVLAKNELWNEAQGAGSPWSPVASAPTLLQLTASSGGKKEAFFRYTEPSVSNLYSEKVFAEHPLSLWALDDRADYIQLLDDNSRNMENWTISGGAATLNILDNTITNSFVNPSFETTDGTEEIYRNLIINPSFESNDGAQEVWRSVYPNPGFESGDTSILVTPTSFDSYEQLQNILLKSNTTYTVLGTIRLDDVQVNPSENARKFGITIAQRDAALDYLEEAPNTVGEHVVRATFETPSDSTVNEFRIYNGDDTVDVVWDKIAIVEGVYLGDYFDGVTSPDIDLLPEWDITSPQTFTNLATNTSFEWTTGSTTSISTNYITNPSFEVNTTGWSTITSNISRTTLEAYSGTASLAITPTSTNGGIRNTSLIETTRAPVSHVASAWIKGTPGLTITIAIREHNGSGTFIGETISQLATNGQWQRISVTRKYAGFAGIAQTEVRLYNASNTAIFYVDAVQLEVSPVLTDYFDGSTPDAGDFLHYWISGTPHNSASYRAARLLGNVSASSNSPRVFQSLTWPESGSKSLRIISPVETFGTNSFASVAGQVDSLSGQGVTFIPGNTYTVKAKLRLDTAQVGQQSLFARRIVVAYSNTSGITNEVRVMSSQAPNSPGVTDHSVTFTVPSDAIWCEIRLYNGVENLYGLDNGVWWDELFITQGEYAGGYFNGDSIDSDAETYSWTGTPHQSTSTKVVASIRQSVLTALVPAGLPFTTENGIAVLSSIWSERGTKSLKIISTSRYEPARYYSTLGDLGLEIGKTYTVLITANLEQPQTGDLYQFPSLGSTFPYVQFDNTTGPQQTRIIFTIDGANIDLNDELSFYNRATVGNGDVWFDSFMIIEGEYLGEYFDGSSISEDPAESFGWAGTPNLSESTQFVSRLLGVTNAYQASGWSMSGEYSMKIPEGLSESFTFETPSTVIITAQLENQKITANGNDVISTQSNQEIRLYNVETLQIWNGIWDNLCIVNGTYLFGYFDGSNDVPGFYSTEWSGVENASTSIATPTIGRIFSIGISDPLDSSTSYLIQASSGSDVITCVSPIFATPIDINDYLSSLSLGMFIGSENENLFKVELGYTTDGQTFITQSFAVNESQQWLYISSQFQELIEANSYQVVIKFYLREANESTRILVNGLSAGQWSEEFQPTSLGAEKVELPPELGLSDFFGVRAEAYGLQDSNGYYIINNNRLLARNTGMPMVYGANNISSIYPHPDEAPSIILPGYGFLNNVGRYRDYTVEFWCRINAGSAAPRRIFGPLHSTDGLYVDGPFLTLKIGEYVGSHYISEWYRPMLIDIIYGKNIIKLLVDGEIVFSTPITASTLVLPEDTLDGIDQDWLGFYAYSDVDQVEIDSFSIYSYQVPPLVSKRRFVYGQGVEFPETMNNSFNGKSLLIDHTFANYSNTYRYPDLGKWIQGVSENVSTNNNILSTPSYSLPRIVFNKQTTQTWYDDLSEVSNSLVDTITMKPNDSWKDTEGYMLFDSLNIVKQDIKAFYGIFHVNGEQITDEVLFKIEDDATKNFLLITVTGDLFNGYNIDYTIRYGANASETKIFTDHVFTINETLFVGVDIDKFARKYGQNLSSFFGNPRRLKVYAAGSKDFKNTFSGEISRIGFCTRRNFAKISSLFGINGTFVPEVYNAGDNYFGNDPLHWDEAVDGGRPDTTFFESDIKNHIASYTLFASKYYDSFMLDIATDSYWEDYIPLTYLGKQVTSYDGDLRYGLDFIQFNIDYPRPTSYNGDSYDTSNSLVRTYVSFQYISSGANQTAASFNKILPAPKNNVIDPNIMLSANESWINKKFEVVNNSIIYLPAGVDFKKLALVIHLEFETNGILKKSVKIKNLQVSSKALEANRPNKIGTRLGQLLYPYTKQGLYFDYVSKNPYTLYRGSTPYLYLTKDSGIQLVGDFNDIFNRGLSTTINQDRASRFRLTAIQTALLYPGNSFPVVPTPIFEVDTKNTTLQFFVISSHPQQLRGTVFVIDKNTGLDFSDAIFFLNGRFVKNPEISTNEWNMLSVAFINNLNLDNVVGAIRINGPAMINNFSFYEETALQQARQASLRQWFGALYQGDDILDWDDWNESTWEDVLTYNANEYDGVNPVELYSAYAGTNKIVISDTSLLKVTNYKYRVYQNISVTPYTITPL